MYSERLNRDIIDTRELPLSYILWVSNTSQDFYKDLCVGDDRNYKHLLEGWNVVPMFTQESTRTHDSFLDAMLKMGARHGIGISDPKASSLEKGESLADTVDTYVGYNAHFIVMRDGREGAPRWAKICALRSYSRRIREFASKYNKFPENLSLPLIFGGGDGSHDHSSQHLLDCATMQYHLNKFTDLNVGIINDLGASRVFASQAVSAAMLGWKLYLYALPGAEIKERELRKLKDTNTDFTIYESFDEFSRCIPELDVLYVHRYQKNLRNERDRHDIRCSPITLDFLKQNGFNENSIVMHARPVDKEVMEIDNTLRYHPWNMSGIQSDFGVPTRMAMAYYPIKNRLFFLEGIIRSLDFSDFNLEKIDLSHIQPTKKKSIDFTTAINRGYVIDHITKGCGTVVYNLLSQILPDKTIILSNVKGKTDKSKPKDVIKIYGGFEWNDALTNVVALFTDPTAEKSCRVSRYLDGYRIEKWALEGYLEQAECRNEKCITNPKYYEKIFFSMRRRTDSDHECPFCHTIQ